MGNNWKITISFSENDDNMEHFAIEAGLKEDANAWELVDDMLALVAREREEVTKVEMTRLAEDEGDDD